MLVLSAAVSACQPDPTTPAPRTAGAVLSATSGTIRTGPAIAARTSVDAGPSTIRFRDVTDSTGIDFVHCSGYDDQKHFPTWVGSGVALLDYDGDGRLDLYFATTRNLPLSAADESGGNKLYRNCGDGTFEDVTGRAGVGYRGFCHGVTAGDVDNDGFTDLVLAKLGPLVLYLNNGDGTFRDATSGADLRGPDWSTGVALLDYDGDGLLDLYVTCYTRWAYGEEQPCLGGNRRAKIFCSPFSVKPERHYLYRNRGGGTFEETTAAAGILRHDGRGLGIVATDVNRDGRIDLYVANDGCPNFLFLNRGDGTFDDAGEVSGAATDGSGEVQGSMGVDAGDIDGDGLPELFTTNFRGQPNALYRNFGAGRFQDVCGSAGIVRDSRPWVGWGCALADFDGDGWPDMLVVNGEVDDNLPEVGLDVPFAQPCFVWRNGGDGIFRVVRDAGPFFETPHVARGAAFGDLDDDGDIDVVVGLLGKRPAVLLNDSDGGRWIGLDLIGRRSNRSAIGAAVAVHAGGRVIHRQVKGGGSYLSSNDPRLQIGVGAADRVDRVEIRWPSGARSTLTTPELDRTHRVREPDATPVVGSAEEGVR